MSRGDHAFMGLQFSASGSQEIVTGVGEAVFA